MTFVDEDGTRRSMMWFKNIDKETLRRKRHYHETVIRLLGAGSAPRSPDVNNSVLRTYVDDPAPWSEQSIGTDGRDLTVGIMEFFEEAKAGDLNAAIAFVDPQTDRSRESAQAESPALRVVSRSDEGIVVTGGVKAIATGAVFCDVLNVGVFFRPGITEEQIIFAAVPANAPGVTMVSRESNVRDGETIEHPHVVAGRRARHHRHLRERLHPVEPGLPPRQPGARVVLPAARVRLGPLPGSRPGDGPRRADAGPGPADHRAHRCGPAPAGHRPAGPVRGVPPDTQGPRHRLRGRGFLTPPGGTYKPTC